MEHQNKPLLLRRLSVISGNVLCLGMDGEQYDHSHIAAIRSTVKTDSQDATTVRARLWQHRPNPTSRN